MEAALSSHVVSSSARKPSSFTRSEKVLHCKAKRMFRLDALSLTSISTSNILLIPFISCFSRLFSPCQAA